MHNIVQYELLIPYVVCITIYKGQMCTKTKRNCMFLIYIFLFFLFSFRRKSYDKNMQTICIIIIIFCILEHLSSSFHKLTLLKIDIHEWIQQFYIKMLNGHSRMLIFYPHLKRNIRKDKRHTESDTKCSPMIKFSMQLQCRCRNAFILIIKMQNCRDLKHLNISFEQCNCIFSGR